MVKKKQSVITVIFKEECKFKLQALVFHSVDYFQLSDESLLKTVEWNFIALLSDVTQRDGMIK